MSCLFSRGADEDLASETGSGALNSILTANLMLRFRDIVITPDAGLLAHPKLDHTLALTSWRTRRQPRRSPPKRSRCCCAL
jgi:hypothetical protein